MEQNNEFTCIVCGFPKMKDHPFDLENYSSSFEVCPCCNFEYGYDDAGSAFSFIDYKKYRNKWINGKLDFLKDENQPKNWDKQKLIEQLKNIKEIDYVPKQFHEDYQQYLKDLDKEIEELSKQ